jgi:hypothetical protein
MKCVLHLGAHKTATTFIQNTLELNISTLHDHGIEYPTLSFLRDNITPLVGRDNDSIRIYFHKILNSEYDRVIFSDENFIGVPPSLLRSGRLYPDLINRMRIFADQFSELEVYFTIRSYEQFWPSYYVEIIRHQPFMSWQEFLFHFEFESANWFDVVSRLVDLFGAEHIKILDYSNFRSQEDQYFRQLIGADLALQKFTRNARESPSNKAIRILHSLQGTLTPADIRKIIWPISNAFPKSHENPGFQPFSAQMVERLQSQFSVDSQRIRSSFGLM